MNEFYIPINLGSQPDIKGTGKTYQINKGSFLIETDGGKLVEAIGLINIGNAQGAPGNCLLLQVTGAKNLYRDKKI